MIGAKLALQKENSQELLNIDEKNVTNEGKILN